MNRYLEAKIALHSAFGKFMENKKMTEQTRLERLVIALLNSPIKQWEAQAELQMGYAGAIVDRAREFEREMDKESGSKPASVNGWSRERFQEELSRQLFKCGLSIDCNSLAETLARVFYDSRKLTTRDVEPEPAPDELPIMDERRVIMTRKQFVGACLWVASVRNQHGYDAQQLVLAFDAYVKKCHE